MTDFDKFMQVVAEIGKYNYGKPSRAYPRFVNLEKKDKHFPPNSIMMRGAKAVRKYWNDKNLRKRVLNKT